MQLDQDLPSASTLKTLDEEKGSLEDIKSTLVAEIYELDNKKDWIDWITKYGDDISKRFDNVTTELLESPCGLCLLLNGI